MEEDPTDGGASPDTGGASTADPPSGASTPGAGPPAGEPTRPAPDDRKPSASRPPPVPQHRNQPPGWRWGRPWTLALVPRAVRVLSG